MTTAESRVEENKKLSAGPLPVAQTLIKNVLFATDFSSTSNAALPYAAAICRRAGATLHTAHVFSETGILLTAGGVDYFSVNTLYEDAQQGAMDRLEELSAGFGDIPHHSHVAHGRVWEGLVPIVRQNKIDLIVLGTHGRSGLGKLLLGSEAEDILRHAPCPVLTIGPNVSGRAKLPAFKAAGRDLAPIEIDLRRIILATNFAYDAPAVAQAAALLADDFGARLTLAHVIEDYGREPWTMEQGMRRLKNLIPPEMAPHSAPEAVLEFGSAWGCILKIARERDADLIVLGARPAADAGSTHFPWSTAHQVIAHAQCPVLTIRG